MLQAKLVVIICKIEEIDQGIYQVYVINSYSQASEENAKLSGAAQAESFVRIMTKAEGLKKFLPVVEFKLSDEECKKHLTDQELKIKHTVFKEFLVRFHELTRKCPLLRSNPDSLEKLKVDKKFLEDAIPKYTLPKQLLWLKTENRKQKTENTISNAPKGWETENLFFCNILGDKDVGPSISSLNETELRGFDEKYSCDLYEIKQQQSELEFSQKKIQQLQDSSESMLNQVKLKLTQLLEDENNQNPPESELTETAVEHITATFAGIK